MTTMAQSAQRMMREIERLEAEAAEMWLMRTVGGLMNVKALLREEMVEAFPDETSRTKQAEG